MKYANRVVSKSQENAQQIRLAYMRKMMLVPVTSYPDCIIHGARFFFCVSLRLSSLTPCIIYRCKLIYFALFESDIVT